MIDQITDHKSQARARLIEQYKESTNLIAILDAFINQVQSLEDAIHSLYLGRWLDQATGKVLDDFGTIIGQGREGFDDDFFRILIYVKMAENISQGETEQVISTYKIITRATICQLQENFPAGISLLSNGSINPITAQFIYDRIQKVVGAGIRVDNIGLMGDAPFGFAGVPTALGFRDLDDPSVIGGTFAAFLDTSRAFGFADIDGAPLLPNSAGFGDLRDPIIGGRFYRQV